jgi:Domain of unknown function (DUF3784)
MAIINLIVGLFLIGMSFLVKAAPDLIAGYNTMPKDKKKNVDIEGLSIFMHNGLILMGLSIIIGYYFFQWVGFTVIANSMILISTLVGTVILVINAQRFDHNKQRKAKLAYFILGVIIVFVLGLNTYGLIPTKTILDNDTIRFTGMYGFDMRISDITNVELATKIPAIILRTNGYSFGTILKGTFKLDEFGKCKLFLHSDKVPFLIITDKNGQKTIINNKDSLITGENYKKIKALMNK